MPRKNTCYILLLFIPLLSANSNKKAYVNNDIKIVHLWEKSSERGSRWKVIAESIESKFCLEKIMGINKQYKCSKEENSWNKG